MMDEDLLEFTDFISQRGSALGALALVCDQVKDSESRDLMKIYMRKIVDSVLVDPPVPQFNQDNVVSFVKPSNPPD